MTALTFGKYKGNNITNVPNDYLEWGAAKLDSLKWKEVFKTELKRRKVLAVNSPDKLLEELKEQAIKDIEFEITKSGREHEYTSWDIYSEAESQAKMELAFMLTKV